MTALLARYRGTIAAIVNGIAGVLVGPTTINNATSATATAYSNQRKIDRCQNGVLWALYWDGSALTPSYSSNNGTSWNATTAISMAGAGTTYTPNASWFIDLDDYAHVVYKDRHDGYIYYRRGTPNAGRTAWTWSAATIVGSTILTEFDYPDVVAHREGTGWVAHVVISSTIDSTSGAAYNRVTITSGGTISVGTLTGIATAYGNANHKWPSIDFNHTGDGKTVAGATPHLYCAWSAGATGAGKGIRFKKATYSGGTWTWGTEREIDNSAFVEAAGGWLNCLFDGTRVVISGQHSSAASTFTGATLFQRDAADTTTTSVGSLWAATTNTQLLYGSMTYDGEGNLYFFGRNSDEASGTYDLVYLKWTRAGATMGAEVVIDASTGVPYVSAKRGYSNNRIEFIYTDGTASPYNVVYGGIS